MVAHDRVEEATARMLELFPEGFAEEPAGDAVDLVAFTDEDGVRRMRESFGEVETAPVADWEDEWKRFHSQSLSARSGSVHRGRLRLRA